MKNEIEISGPESGPGDAPPPYKTKLSSVSVKSQQNNQGGEPFVQNVQEKRGWDDECCPGCSKRCCLISGVIVSIIGLILLILVIFAALWFKSAFSSPNSDENAPPDDGIICTCNSKNQSNSKTGNSECKATQFSWSSDGAGNGEKNCANFGFCLWEEGKDGKVKRDCVKPDPRHEYGCLKIDGVTRCICECSRCNREKPEDDECWGTDCSKDESHLNSSSTSSNGTSSSTDKPNQRSPKPCDSASHDFPLLPLPSLVFSVVSLEFGIKCILLILHVSGQA